MTVTLFCSIVKKSFDYTIPIVSGNLGGASKMVKLTVSREDQSEYSEFSDNIELHEGDELLLKSTPDAHIEETEQIAEEGKFPKADVLRITSNMLTRASSHTFSIKCPWGHWHRFIIDIDGI